MEPKSAIIGHGERNPLLAESIGQLTAIFKESRGRRLDRKPPVEKDRILSQQTFAHHIEEVMGHMESGAVGLTAASRRQRLEGELAVRGHLADWVTSHFQPGQPIEFRIPDRCAIHGIPYDEEWTTGKGLGLLSRFDGKVFVWDGAPYSAAGLGLYLTSPVDALAQLRPAGTYDGFWMATKDLPGVRSRCGLGTAVYKVGDSQPVTVRQALLWNLRGIQGAKFIAVESVKGQIADAASPATGFGPVPLAPLFLHMSAKTTYLVWYWIWHSMQSPPLDPGDFGAMVSMNLPYVNVCIGPPLELR